MLINFKNRPAREIEVLAGAYLIGANLIGADLPEGFRIARLDFGGRRVQS